jgi:hypothetical protein
MSNLKSFVVGPHFEGLDSGYLIVTSIFKTYVDSIVFELHLPVQPGVPSQ